MSVAFDERLCQKCGTRVRIPRAVPEVLRARVRELFARGENLAVVRELREQLPLELGEAKALMFHLSRAHRCQRCKAPVAAGVVACASCTSLNVDWEDA